MRILITGANGFIGGRLTRALKKRRTHHILGVDMELSPWNSALELKKMDLAKTNKIESILSEFRPTSIVLSGAIKGLTNCAGSFSAANVNVFSLAPFINYALKYDAHLIFISSDMVFGSRDKETAPFSEISPVGANNAYGAFKIAGEQLCGIVNKNSIVRTALVYGPFLKEEMKYFHKDFLSSELMNQSWLPQWIAARCLRGQKTRMADNIYSTPTYIDDLIDDLIIILENGIYGIIHSSGPDRISRYNMAKIVAKYLKTETLITKFNAPTKGIRPLDISLEASASRILLGRSQTTSIEKGLESTLLLSGLLK